VNTEPVAQTRTLTPAGSTDSPTTRAGLTALLLFLLALLFRLPFLWLTNNNGTDAWARYVITLGWLKNPGQVPSNVWLPLHFWLLGGALSFWNSEWSARLLTLIFGASTVLPYWGMLRRAFNPRVAFWSSLFFVFLFFHVAYSVTTSSETPTIFFLVLGFYGWVRFQFGDGWIWLLPSGLGLSAASLCRFEVWVVIPVLTIFLLDFSAGWNSLWSNREAWARTASFGLASSVGAIGWMLFSLRKWGNPLAAAEASAGQSKRMLLHQSLLHRLAAVPGALVVTLSPLVVGLAVWGLVVVWPQRDTRKRALAAAFLVMAGFQLFNSVTSNLTMARFTLMYSWLFIPFSFVALFDLSKRWPVIATRTGLIAGLVLFLLWQAAVTVGAYYAPPAVAARLSSVAVTLPLDPELRNLTSWMKTHRSPGESVIVDEYLYEASDIIRYSHIPFSEALSAPVPWDGPASEAKVAEFIRERRPRFLVYCPSGMLGEAWSLGDEKQLVLLKLNIRLTRRWKGEHYSVYEIRSLDATAGRSGP
jgi:4-amino-4-deoxy-L-arabinose transferase-like glycosyltransferase